MSGPVLRRRRELGFAVVDDGVNLGNPGKPTIKWVRIGSGLDTDLLEMTFDPTQGNGKWVGEEFCVLHSGDTTPIILSGIAAVTVKQPVGHPDNGSTWGALPPRRVNICYSKGLTLEYRQKGFLQATSGNILINVGAYWFEFNHGDTTPNFVAPPVGGRAEGAYLHGGVPPGASSAYEWNEAGWATLPLIGGAPAKSMLYPKPYAFMDSGAAGTSEVGYAVFCRYVRVL